MSKLTDRGRTLYPFLRIRYYTLKYSIKDKKVKNILKREKNTIATEIQK